MSFSLVEFLRMLFGSVFFGVIVIYMVLYIFLFIVIRERDRGC